MKIKFDHQPIEYPQKLPGSFWGITTFFNPAKYKNKIRHYRYFRKICQQQGLKLITVECAFDNNSFELTNQDADILLTARSHSVLWQKERLLNLAFNQLPPDCDKIVWLDSDIIFLNDDWVKNTTDLLEKFIVVKPFTYALRLSKKDTKKIIKSQIIDFPKICYSDREFRLYDNSLNNFINYSAGFAWAARKEIFNKVGFYDKMIIGGGDSIMMAAFINHPHILPNLSPDLEKDIDTWSKEINKNVKNSVSFIKRDGIIHLFHGSGQNREYVRRYQILKNSNFDPGSDLRLNEYGCWEWSSPKKRLHYYLKEYFDSRNEGSSFIKNLKYFIKNKNKRNLNIDYFIGQVGIKIKRVSPCLYFFLKKLLLIK